MIINMIARHHDYVDYDHPASDRFKELGFLYYLDNFKPVNHQDIYLMSDCYIISVKNRSMNINEVCHCT